MTKVGSKQKRQQPCMSTHTHTHTHTGTRIRTYDNAALAEGSGFGQNAWYLRYPKLLRDGRWST